MDLVIRRARRSDKRDVLAAVRTIWGGQDRIPDVFDRWVTHRTGPFFVAESGGRVVGMGKLTVVSPTGSATRSRSAMSVSASCTGRR